MTAIGSTDFLSKSLVRPTIIAVKCERSSERLSLSRYGAAYSVVALIDSKRSSTTI